MLQLKVTVNKLNRRSSIPLKLPSPEGIIDIVKKDFTFEGSEVNPLPANAAPGKWYVDKDDMYYWGGGLAIIGAGTPPVPAPSPAIPVAAQPSITIAGLPKNLPSGFKVGVDVSHHNANPDWAGFKAAGVDFVYIKISEGLGTPDNKALVNATNAAANNLRIGYYHFCRPDIRSGGNVALDAENEAKEAVSIMKRLPAAVLPLVLDLEDQANWDTPLNKQSYALWISTFLKTLKDLTATDGIIYSRTEYLNSKLPPDHKLGNTPLWLSAYPAHPDVAVLKLPTGWNDWYMWQYTEKGKIGKTAVVDINVMR